MAIKTYTAFLVRQRPNVELLFAVFVAPAKEVYAWSHADSISLDRSGVQRELVASRWKQIGRFFAVSQQNVIPTNVTIAFSEEVPCIDSLDALHSVEKGYFIEHKGGGLVEISFPESVKETAYIIDGQHRLKGMSVVEEQVIVPVCLLLSVSKVERAFQFVTINNKSHKVPTDNLKALISNFGSVEGELQSRLRQSSVPVPKLAGAIDFLNENTSSPFHKMVNWVNNRFADRKPVFAAAALENSLRAVQRSFPEEADDEAELAELLAGMWTRIFELSGVTYENIEQYVNLVKKPAIQAISEMVVEKVRHDYDPAFSDGQAVTASGLGDAAAKLVFGIPSWFWTDEWRLKSLDTSAGRDIIKNDLRELKRHLVQGMLESDVRRRLVLYKDSSSDAALGSE